jgi:hypothetical protein
MFNLFKQERTETNLINILMSEEELLRLRRTPEKDIEEFLEEHNDPCNCYGVYEIILDRSLCRALGISHKEPTKVDCYVALRYLLRVNSLQDCEEN